MDDAIRILIGADIAPTESSVSYFSNSDMDMLVGSELLDILRSGNIRIFNLEAPLSDEKLPITKCGPNLCAETSAIKGIKMLNPTFVTLANNHILDQGQHGLASTINMLQQENIAFAGVGNNAKDVRLRCTWITEIQNIRVGIYVCAEHEFSIATEKTPGAHGFDPVESYDIVQELRKQCEYLIVLYHGGKEYYRYPSPDLQKYCRRFVDKGADVVVCQHSHSIGCEEKYKKGTIIYGQGNFLFDKTVNECWKTSLLINVEIKENSRVTYIPLVKKEHGVRLADEKTANEILTDFRKRSMEIQDREWLEAEYSKFAKESTRLLLKRLDLISDTIIFKIFNKISLGKLETWYFKKVFCKKKVQILNTVECEAWRELLIRSLKNEDVY